MPRGGKREGAGRPTGSTSVHKEDSLSVQVAVRLTEGEKKRLEELASQSGLTVSKFIHKILAEHF